MPLDSQTKKPKGLAYITFSKPDDALAAYEALDKKSFQGRLLHILAAVDRNGKAKGDDGDGRKKSVKEERTSKRKADAGRAFNWGMLYMSVRSCVLNNIIYRVNGNEHVERCCSLLDR
jgi:multiple RNA-binding domain-containing protein 1